MLSNFTDFSSQNKGGERRKKSMKSRMFMRQHDGVFESFAYCARLRHESGTTCEWMRGDDFVGVSDRCGQTLTLTQSYEVQH